MILLLGSGPRRGREGGAMRRLWIETAPFWGDTVEDYISGALSLAQHLNCGVNLNVNGVSLGVLPDETVEKVMGLYHRLTGIIPRSPGSTKG
jgi:hypothetical protein